MARRRKMTPERREFINGLLEHYQPTDAQDVQEMLKDLLGDTLQGCIFRKNCASVPEERSAIPLQTEQSSAG